MSDSSIWQLQKSIYNYLSGENELSNKINGVFTHVPQNTNFPYIKLSSISESPISIKQNKIIKSSFTILVFSQQRSLQEILDIVSISKDSLANTNLTLEDYNLIRLDHMNTEVQLQSDGLTWGADVSFEAILEGNN